jgi:hypothetical protein
MGMGMGMDKVVVVDDMEARQVTMARRDQRRLIDSSLV